MIFRRLDFRIGLNLFLLLALGMGLVNLVMTLALQRTLVRREMDRAERIAAVLARRDPVHDLSEDLRLIASLERGIGIAVFRPTNGAPAIAPTDTPGGATLAAMALAAERDGRPNRRVAGETWGVFWKRPAVSLAASPLSGGGAVGVSVDLRPLYAHLRQAEVLVFGYLFVNLALLTFVGVHRLRRIAVHPLHRLLNRAEAFRDEEEMFFMGEGDDGEFTQLSRSLNRMLFRISEGKRTLRSAVRSLETANRELRRARQDAINAEKLASVGRLSAGIAHEIGNPIAIVVGYLDLMKQPDLPEAERAEFLRRTEQEVHRINAIIRRLLDLSRPSPGRPEPVSIHELLRELAEIVSCQPLMADIRLDLSPDATNDRVKADPGQLRQVFLNLLINAADAIAAKGEGTEGRIRTSTRNRFDPRPEIEIAVSDNGSGIPEAQLSQIFDPFFTTKEPGKGTGLGLSVSFMIVQAAGGTIGAFAPPEGGTRIVVRLPLHPEES